MAIIDPENFSDESSLSQNVKLLLSNLERNLSNEWEFYVQKKIARGQFTNIIVLNPEFGIFFIVISDKYLKDLNKEELFLLNQSELVTEKIKNFLISEASLPITESELRFAINYALIFLSKNNASFFQQESNIKSPNFIIDINGQEDFSEKFYNEIETLVGDAEFPEMTADEMICISNLIPNIGLFISNELENLTIPNKNINGDETMVKDELIRSISGHLEFLGYEIEMMELEHGKLIKCLHPSELNIVIFFVDKFSWVIIQSLPLLSIDLDESNELSVLKTINSLNNDNILAVCRIDEDGAIAARMNHGFFYDKILFGQALSVFKTFCSEVVDKLSHFVNPSDKLGSDSNDGDDIPF